MGLHIPVRHFSCMGDGHGSRMKREPARGSHRPPCGTPRRICLSPLRGLRPTVCDGHVRHCRASHFLAHWASVSLSPSANAPLGHRSAPAPGLADRRQIDDLIMKIAIIRKDTDDMPVILTCRVGRFVVNAHGFLLTDPVVILFCHWDTRQVPPFIIHRGKTVSFFRGWDPAAEPGSGIGPDACRCLRPQAPDRANRLFF